MKNYDVTYTTQSQGYSVWKTAIEAPNKTIARKIFMGESNNVKILKIEQVYNYMLILSNGDPVALASTLKLPKEYLGDNEGTEELIANNPTWDDALIMTLKEYNAQ